MRLPRNLAICLLVVAFVALLAPAGYADSAPPVTARPFDAHFLADHAGTVPIVSYGGNRYRAGTMLYRIGTSATAEAYSLDLLAPDQPDAAAYDAASPSSAAIPGLSQVTWLVANNQVDADPTGSPARALRIAGRLAVPVDEAAAMQAAIWSFTNGLPLTPATVRNTAVLVRARQLRRAALSHLTSTSSETYLTGLSIQPISGDVGSMTVSVGLDRPAGVRDPSQPYCFQYALGSSIGEIATGYVNDIPQAGRAEGSQDASPGCQRARDDYAENFGAIATGHRSRDALRTNDDPPDLWSATVRMPRGNVNRNLLVTFRFALEPGIIFESRRSSAPFITASVAHVQVNGALSVGPATFRDLESLAQNQVIRVVARPGWEGWCMLGFVLVVAGLLVRIGSGLADALVDWVRGSHG